MHIIGSAEPNRVIVRGTMRLTRQQENELCRTFMERFETARKEMGYMGAKRSYDPVSLLGKWNRYTKEYGGDFSHRAQEDELYEFYNHSDNQPQRAIRVFKAKAAAKLLNTEPWFSVGQARRGKEDPRIKLVDEYFEELIEEADGRPAFNQAIEGAGIRGVQIMKIGRRVDQVFARADVRMLLVGGMELKDSAGRPVTDKDEWEDEPESLEGAKRLKRDPRIRLVGEPQMSDPVNMPSAQVTRRGLSIECKPWQDFFTSPTARNIHEADCFDVYDLDVDDMLSRMYAGGGELSDEAEEWLKKIRLEDGQAKTDSGVANENQGEREEAKDTRPKAQIAEGWIRVDADGDNRAEEMHVVMDVTNEQPIFYGYMQEASPTEKKPYVPIRMIPVENRWTGVGMYELLQNQHIFIDRQRCRIDARSGLSGGIKMQRAGAIRETKFGVPLRFNDSRFYTVEDGIEFKDALGVFVAPPMAEECWKMLESERQNSQLLSGTLTPQDQDMSNSPGADTLGGLELMAKESEILNDDALQGPIYGIREALDQGARVVLTPEGFDPKKCVDVMGDADAQQVAAWVAEGEARNLSRRIKLLLTKSRSLQQLQSNKQALEVLDKWDTLTPEQQMRYFDIFVSILNSLEVAAPDKVLGDPEARLAMMQAQEAEAAAMAQQSPNQPANALTAPSSSPTGPTTSSRDPRAVQAATAAS